MNVIIVIVMQGTPPRDFPQYEVAELFTLHTRLKYTFTSERESLEQRYAELDKKIRNWPRTEHNDPLFATSQQLSVLLKQVAGYEVIVAFNGYCSPDVNEAIDLAIKKGADKVVVTTTIMTCVGGQSEVDIGAAIGRAQAQHTGVPIVYAWPFDISEVARFLSAHITRFIS
jgi:sirohydrochlorin cobaltochelatase